MIGNGRTSRAAALLLLASLALTGCGEKKPADGSETRLDDGGSAELARFQAEENARSRVTMVDAATGDSAAMPAESNAPTAFDLKPLDDERRAREKAEKAPEAKPSEPTPAPVEEELPSVAE